MFMIFRFALFRYHVCVFDVSCYYRFMVYMKDVHSFQANCKLSERILTKILLWVSDGKTFSPLPRIGPSHCLRNTRTNMNGKINTNLWAKAIKYRVAQWKVINAVLRIGSSNVVLPADFGIFDCILHEVDSQLFKSMQNSQHCMNRLLPDTRSTAYFKRRRNHPYELPHHHYSWSRCSFVNRSLHNFIWYMVFILYCFELIYYHCPYSHVRTYTFCCLYLIKINQSIIIPDATICHWQRPWAKVA